MIELELHDVDKILVCEYTDTKVKLNIKHGEGTLAITMNATDAERLWFSIRAAQRMDSLRRLRLDRVERMKKGRLA
tara:strand:+ start:312 stop:539 length:228 start_codon:yes stop_codon:yes gene_type:complete